VSRTPLFRLVQRSYALARESARTGVPVDEVVERAREARITRRSFLGGTAAAAGLALAGRPRRAFAAPARNARDGEVLVVGAGIAGLTAAWRLHQAAVPVRVLEAQDRAGGRMYSLRDFFPEGQVCELGGELIDTRHVHVRALAEELEIPLDDFVLDDLALSRDLFFFDGRRIGEAELVQAFLPVSDRLVRDLATIGGEVSYREPNGAEELDRTTLAEWLERSGATGWLRKLLEVAYTTELGLEIDRQSALNLLLLIDPNPAPFRIYGGSDERFHVRGGNDRIPLELARRLGERIETGTRLEAVSKAADGSFRCSVRRGSASRELRARHLVLTLPFTLLREVRLDPSLDLSPAKQRAIRELGYGTNAKLMAGFSRRVWRALGSNGSSMTDLPYQISWETSRLQPGRHGILTNFTGGRQGEELGKGTAAEQAAAFVDGLEKVFPGISAARPGMKEARFHWPSFAWTRGSYSAYLPGQWTGFGGAEGEPAGNLRFAGEHCSRDAAGFMEGGCETGEAAAQEILAELSTAARLTLPAAG
jgi:monoamine oxidase